MVISGLLEKLLWYLNGRTEATDRGIFWDKPNKPSQMKPTVLNELNMMAYNCSKIQ